MQLGGGGCTFITMIFLAFLHAGAHLTSTILKCVVVSARKANFFTSFRSV